MSLDTITGAMMNGRATPKVDEEERRIEKWNKGLKKIQNNADFHGDKLLGDKQIKLTGLLSDLVTALAPKNIPSVIKLLRNAIAGKGMDIESGAQLIGSLSNNSAARSKFIQLQVEDKYDKMLHPPLTYLGDAFQYRTADGKFNSALNPHLGQGGAPYAKTVPSKTHPLGALPDPGDLFDRLMARQGGRDSTSGLSSMLIYHATIIIHDIFRTNDSDKNISDSSSYLDLSPLYGYTMEMQRQVRDDKFKLGLLKPDTFAEDRLLRQPPGVCIMLVMYSRYHNYAATQLKRINENGRFQVPARFEKLKLLAAADECIQSKQKNRDFVAAVETYEKAWKKWDEQGRKPANDEDEEYADAEKEFREFLQRVGKQTDKPGEISFLDTLAAFEKAYDAAWNKLDDDLFNTARLITCGQYVNISIHDYLRALMGFHQFNTNFTLDPRIAMTEHKNVSRGLGNQVTVEFNLLYRFHCAISQKDEEYTKEFMEETMKELPFLTKKNPNDLSMMEFGALAQQLSAETKKDPWLQEFGLKNSSTQTFKRNTITGLFDDQLMINQLRVSMEDPISNFGPQNVPKSLRNVEIMGILQARKWECGTLNDFRDFFGLGRHETFEQMTSSTDIQEALRDLYDHPDKVELYPGIFCESGSDKDLDPGPKDHIYALWSAIFSDAITLVRSDRFYTVDWNTNSLTSWGMAEVTPNNDVLKSSVFHRLLQRSFPGWFPYDSINFFHPFYTSQKNAEYAKTQGYASTFAMSEPLKRNSASPTFNVEASKPEKPIKPLYLTKYSEIKSVLSTPAAEIVHPAFVNPQNLPPKVAQALSTIKSTKTNTGKSLPPDEMDFVKKYFVERTRHIVEREVILMDRDKGVFQVDVTRDVAIPVVTHCIADFLGFGEQIKDTGNPTGKYSENEIYQHITNCQVFLSYNTDETKLLKRRAAFKESMQFLLELAEEGNVLEASRWSVLQPIRFFDALLRAKSSYAKQAESLRMKALGQAVATRILQAEKDTGKVAAILLLTALDIGYTSVLAFTTVLDHLLQGAYDLASAGGSGTCDWFKIQEAALEDDEDTDDTIETMILEAQRSSLKMPFIRKVVKDGVKISANGKTVELKKGQNIICDIYEAMTAKDPETESLIKEYGHLNYLSSLSSEAVNFNPKYLAKDSLTMMIKTMAQMKNLRRGHTAQGIVKKIEIDSSNEGYANFMAPERMAMIARDAANAASDLKNFEDSEANSTDPPEARETQRKYLQQRVEDAQKVYSPQLLRPKSDTFLTAEWDEMVPFPTTWKLRFESYGASTYTTSNSKIALALLRPDPQPDSFPPFYQPQGASSWGGVLGDATGHEGVEGKEREKMPAEVTEGGGKGCGVPVPVLHSALEGGGGGGGGGGGWS